MVLGKGKKKGKDSAEQPQPETKESEVPKDEKVETTEQAPERAVTKTEGPDQMETRIIETPTGMEVPVPAEEADLLEKIQKEMPDIAANFRHLILLMNPYKPGQEEIGASWTPPFVKVNQPTSGDAPDNAKLGSLYTDTGDVLEHPFLFTPLYLYVSHSKFEEGSQSPTCRSEDGITSIYGDSCDNCPDKPFRGGKPTQCHRSLNAFVYDAEFKSVFRIQFSKTSYRAGAKLRKQAGSTMVPWERTYSLDTEQATRKDGSGKYFVMKVGTTGEKVDPKFGRLAQFIHGKILNARKAQLEALRERQSNAEVTDQLPDDFGDTGNEEGGNNAGFDSM